MFKLPKLNYQLDALEPVVSKESMALHYLKHHQAYVDNLNKAVQECSEVKGWSLVRLATVTEQIKCSKKQTIINNAGGHYNHSMFWEVLGPYNKDDNQPVGKTAMLINKEYGSFSNFKKQFSDAALARFGSGWVFLQPDGKIISTANQDTPMMQGLAEPLMGLDVWEHAYYLDYQNKRAEYIDKWWDIVNWQGVEERYEQITNTAN